MADSGWVPSMSAITLVVTDLEQSKNFYSRAFSVDPVFEDDDSKVFRFGSVLINLLQRSAADELLAPAAVGSPTDAPRIVFTVQVPDTDAYCAGLAEQGVTLLNGPVTRPWGPRTASFADPDGHVWEIAS